MERPPTSGLRGTALTSTDGETPRCGRGGEKRGRGRAWAAGRREPACLCHIYELQKQRCKTIEKIEFKIQQLLSTIQFYKARGCKFMAKIIGTTLLPLLFFTGRNLPSSANIFAQYSPEILPDQHEELQIQLRFQNFPMIFCLVFVSILLCFFAVGGELHHARPLRPAVAGEGVVRGIWLVGVGFSVLDGGEDHVRERMAGCQDVATRWGSWTCLL